MRLSERAKALLDSNSIRELQALPLSDLLHPSDYVAYQHYCEHTGDGFPSTLYSVPAALADSVSFNGLVDAVVVSSGQIYSKATIESLLPGVFRCPNTRASLHRDCYGPIGAKTSFVSLPKIDAALTNYRELKATNTIAEALALHPDHFDVQLIVSSSKLRVILLPNVGSNPELLRDCIKVHLPNPASEIKLSEGVAGYGVESFGRCWQIKRVGVRIDFWFPQGSINDEEVNGAITALLQPLALPVAPLPPGERWGSIRLLAPREYKDAFPAIAISAAQAARCCMSFLQYTKSLIEHRGQVPNDVVIPARMPILPSLHSGLMLFGAPPSAPGPIAASAGPPSSAAGGAVVGATSTQAPTQFRG